MDKRKLEVDAAVSNKINSISVLKDIFDVTNIEDKIEIK